MVPFYLCYMAGISMAELRSDSEISAGAHGRLILSACLFALGVTTIFMLLGMGATAIGQTFRQWMQPLSWVAAAILLLFGLHFLGVVRIPLLYREARLETNASPTTFVGAYVMGLAFGFGWTPCVGPALAAILMMASTQETLGRGAALLLVYGLGMTAPFVLAAVFVKPFLRWLGKRQRYLAYVERVMGLMLVAFAVLIATGSVNLIADFMIRHMPWTTRFI
jgi:cytochrome c-type biogenesis protein